MLRKQDSQDVPRLSTRHMLAEEIAYVRGTTPPCPEKVDEWAREKNLTALCLSGGGIRSASFCLGVVQALAQKGLLRQFDYLSTVSGGGYIGGWLQQLIREAGHKLDLTPYKSDVTPQERAQKRVQAAEEVLHKHEPPALDRLRDNTNFLTPRGGVGSPDIWAGVALYLRNLMHNWLVLAPVFLLAALAPILHRTTIWWVGQFDLGAVVAMAVAALALGQSVYLVCRWVPSHCTDAMRETLEMNSGLTSDAGKKLKWLQIRIIGGALAWAVLLPVGLQFLLGHGWRRWFFDGVGSWGLWLLPLVHVLTMLAAYCLAWAVTGFVAWRTGKPEQEDRGWRLYRPNFIRWMIASLGTGMVFLIALRLLWAAREWLVVHDVVADVLTLGAPLALLGILLSQSTFYLGLGRRAVFADLDREWLARMNGIILGIGVGWTLFAVACLLIPKLTLPGGKLGRPVPEGVLIGANALSTLVSGFAASWLGKLVIGQVQSVAGSKPPGQMLALALKVLPVVFVVSLFGFMGAVLQLGLGRLQEWSIPIQNWLMPSVQPTCNIVETLGDIDLFVSGLLCTTLPPYFTAPVWPLVFQGMALLLLWLNLRVANKYTNVNRFSLHALYRNRLTRAFLGTPREKRRPDPFTGFDNDDDPRLKDFRDDICPGQRLFPVINMTLNMTTGTRTAWAERQGASFTATPLHCGSADLSATRNFSAKPSGAYVATERFGGQENAHDKDGKNKGTRLGSMMTVSGAAASPHMGYNSSPPIAFLMTLFNLRLGAWYPNPATATDAALRLAKPEGTLWALLGELTGSARADTQAIYLSDGGHFDNLGVYEMIRRRCKRILVIDAGQDGKYTFFDLGMMIRKAEIDFPVRITIDPEIIPTRKSLKKDSVLRQKTTGFARGKIEYLDENGEPNDEGVIIYVKPCLLADAPAGVKSYAADNLEFPHESTNDQWFSESQFESYRSLGVCQGLHILKDVREMLFGNEESSINPG